MQVVQHRTVAVGKRDDHVRLFHGEDEYPVALYRSEPTFAWGAIPFAWGPQDRQHGYHPGLVPLHARPMREPRGLLQ
jgi:hypothetical protein